MLTLLDKKPALEEILSAITYASDEELSEIIRTLLQTYANLFPDQDVVFLSLPKEDPEQRRQLLDCIKDMAFG